MSNSIIKQVIILGALAIIGIIGIQSYWVMRTWDLKEDEFHRTVNIALINVAHELAKFNDIPLPGHDLVNRKSSNYYIVNINNIFDADVLEYYLLTNFENYALDTDFEYAVYDCSSDEMVAGDFCKVSDNTRKPDVPLGVLPKDDEFTYYFGVKFPSRSSYLLDQMQLSILFSLILFLAILFFIYSIFVILRQKRLTEMQKDFINNMTHEFKTPISTIKISADVFLNHENIKSDQRLLRYASLIEEQNNRLNNQVEKVLQLASMEKNGIQPKLEKVDLHELITDIIYSNEIKISPTNGFINGELKAATPIINADKVHLTNILHNLLDNAIKYCKEKPEITITTEDINNRIVLTVSDNGIGIPLEHQQKVFNKFYRIPTGNIHNVKGFGLGLFYLKNIAEAHGWKVLLESKPSEGTTFKIFFNKQQATFGQWISRLFSGNKKAADISASQQNI